MYNLHCHSLLSDGSLLPSEIAVRYAALGYKAIAITDHVDYSNIETVSGAILKFCRHWPAKSNISVLPGLELTHIPLKHFKPLVSFARRRGIKIIVGHGQTPAEPVEPGTNRAALEAGVDILAHPGRISPEDIMLAAQKNIFLEITSRHSHAESNAYVAGQARKLKAPLMLNLDSHQPEDIISPQELMKVGLDAGLKSQDITQLYFKVKTFLKNKGVR
jgi:histidinol phosphatase-like PHP family hydrolase